MQYSQPLVSIVIPSYNHEQFVKDSIQSVIDQDYENIELIVIDDGSKDSSVLKIEEMVESCQKRFIRFEFRSRANIGLSATLNEALEWCEGKYFSAIASDDQMLFNKTKIQVLFLENHKKVVAVFGGLNLIDEKNKKIEEWLRIEKSYSFKEIIMQEHELLTPTSMIRMRAIKRIGGYIDGLFLEDWYMWLKLAEIGELRVLPVTLSNYRNHESNASKDMEKINIGRIKVLEEFTKDVNYKKALNNVYWMNSLTLLRFDFYAGLKSFGILLLKSPVLTTKKFILKINTKLKYKKN